MRAHLLALPLVALVFAACSSTPPAPTEPEATDKTSSAIINGQADTTHDAVVMVLAQETDGSGQPATGSCTGTIVKVDAARHIGWVATAAHCVDKAAPSDVFMGPDIAASSGVLRYEVLDFAADPQYGQAGGELVHDFAMVRIIGVDGTTPVIPLTSSPDGLATGQTMLSVGYGLTSPGGPDNTIRHSVQKSIAQLTASTIRYSQTTSGICFGDSGGPVIAGTGASERVVGIHSTVGNGGCGGTGNSNRVTTGLGFFNGVLNQGIPPEDCGLCSRIATSGKGECTTYTAKCLADTECSAFYKCLVDRGPSARSACLKEHPKAEGPFNAAANCACTRACASKCNGSVECATVPKCGFKLPAGDCTTCTEGACCQETLDCAADGTCYLCLKNKDADPACATNPARKAMATCVASKCKTQCAGSGLDTGADPNVPEGSGGATDPNAAAPGSTQTITTTGCSTAPGTSSGSGFVLALAGVAAAFARRRQTNAA
ncbi:MAG: S1 family peptidase [Deltaproteobacteria bacterium]|nr:S1 family peptidase [Deltaproteobacteria bacterium]